MLKNLMLILFLVCFIAESRAQESSKTFLNRFELVGSPSLSKNTGYLNQYDSKAGYSFGVGYYQQVYKSFFVNIRSLYEMKGSAASYRYSIASNNSSLELNDKYTTRFKYFTFYVMPTLQLGRSKNITVGAGAYYSLLHKLSVNRYTTQSDNGSFVSEYTATNKDYFDPQHDAGLSFQVGYSFHVSDKTQLMLQAFSNRGVVDLHTGNFGSQRNNTYGMLLSLRLR
jgi:hypothetical protein